MTGNSVVRKSYILYTHKHAQQSVRNFCPEITVTLFFFFFFVRELSPPTSQYYLFDCSVFFFFFSMQGIQFKISCILIIFLWGGCLKNFAFFFFVLVSPCSCKAFYTHTHTHSHKKKREREKIMSQLSMTIDLSTIDNKTG